MSLVADNLDLVNKRIEAASLRSGRDASSVVLVAVSKTWTIDHVQLAVDAGHRVLGENKLQEGQEKIPVMNPDIEWHYIGGLQRNKVRKVFTLFDWVHSIDSIKLARYADGVAADMGLRPKVLMQVNVGAELSKGGFELDQIRQHFEELIGLKHLQVEGLMCIPPAVLDPNLARPFFKAMLKLKTELEKAHKVDLPHLSMGMSGDFEVAIEEGATMVRVGSSIFGARNYHQ